VCLGVPGRILEIADDEGTAAVGPVAAVDFQGSRIEVSLAMTPEAAVGDWVLVHAGFAIARLDAEEARETWEYLDAADLGEMPAELRAGRGAGGADGEADGNLG